MVMGILFLSGSLVEIVIRYCTKISSWLVTCLTVAQSRHAISTFFPGDLGVIVSVYCSVPPGAIWLQVEMDIVVYASKILYVSTSLQSYKANRSCAISTKHLLKSCKSS